MLNLCNIITKYIFVIRYVLCIVASAPELKGEMSFLYQICLLLSSTS